jgi:ADP-heptose:LPS heptosyltransferase
LQKTLPWRRRVIIVRIDNRVGEALLTTPLVSALSKTHEVHLVVHPKCKRVLEGLPGITGLHVFERAWLWRGWWRREVAALRALARGSVVVNAASWVEYSGTPALVSRLLGAGAVVVGPSVGPLRLLMDVPVLPRTDTRHEVTQRLHLLSPMVAHPQGEMAFRTPRASTVVQDVATHHPQFAVVNPGGRLGERRVPLSVFAFVAARLMARGIVPFITWGPGEEALVREVASTGVGIVAPATSLDELAFLMSKAQLVVCNNTGPMHLAVAVGAPTLALFWKMPVEQWGHPAAPHVMVDLTPIPAAQMNDTVARALEQMLRGR